MMWNRLEASPRNETQLDNALRFEIRDALWMLTRQWQFGELDGEDAGTAAFTRITGQASPVKGVGSPGMPFQPFDLNQGPLELPIEREEFIPSVADRLEMGRHWERILRKRAGVQTEELIQQFRSRLPFQVPIPLTGTGDRAYLFQHAQKFSDETSIGLTGALAGGRAADGYALLLALRAGKPASGFLDQANPVVDAAGQEFMQWFERVFGQKISQKTSWHPQHLEYQPSLLFSGVNGEPQTLSKEEYDGDGVEWHGFTAKPLQESQRVPAWSGETPVLSAETVIPAGVRFRGMPAKRLWEMEDGQVDFGSIRPASTELSKMLFAEFGLVYGNDWFVAPIRFPSGSICRITGMVVTDIFGKETRLAEIPPEKNWSFFQTQGEDKKQWLFLSNTAPFVEESKPVEKVSFVRDEMANMVWGVEEIIASPYGGGREGETLAKQTGLWIRSLETPLSPAGPGKLLSEGWAYKAGTLMAENRIPFIPMSVEPAQLELAGRRKVMLQRAATPRVSNDFQPVRIRPRTRLLGWTGKPENEKPAPLLIFEEEIPRTGVALSMVWKRVRWFDGQTLHWLARKKEVGKGEIDANFRFDLLQKREATPAAT